jgi:hypothetical protein
MPAQLKEMSANQTNFSPVYPNCFQSYAILLCNQLTSENQAIEQHPDQLSAEGKFLVTNYEFGVSFGMSL